MSTIRSAMQWAYPRSSNDEVPIRIRVRTQLELLNIRAEQKLDSFDDAIHFLARRARTGTPPAPQPVTAPATVEQLRARCGAEHPNRTNVRGKPVSCRLGPGHAENGEGKRHRWWNRDGARLSWNP